MLGMRLLLLSEQMHVPSSLIAGMYLKVKMYAPYTMKTLKSPRNVYGHCPAPASRIMYTAHRHSSTSTAMSDLYDLVTALNNHCLTSGQEADQLPAIDVMTCSFTSSEVACPYAKRQSVASRHAEV